MSYDLEFTDRAIADLRRLESWLAEETLDELERLVQAPPKPRRRHLAGIVYDFVREREKRLHYVFVTVEVKPVRNLIKVSEIGSYARPLP